MQRIQRLPITLRILAYAAAAATVLAFAAGVGVMAALTLGPSAGSKHATKSEQIGEAKPRQGNHEQGSRSEDAREGAPDAPSVAAYSSVVAGIQNGAVEASLESNNELQRYDGLTAEDVEQMKANYVALKGYARRARDLAPPAKYEDQHEVFVQAIVELRDADELAYRLAADPSSATQAGFEAYDRRMDRATAYLERSNELLGKDYKAAGEAREIGFG